MPPNHSHNRNNKNQNRGDPRMKKCEYCDKNVQYVDYKDYPTMKPFIDYFGNIRARYYSGLCLKHQKMLRLAVERARFMAFLAYRK